MPEILRKNKGISPFLVGVVGAAAVVVSHWAVNGETSEKTFSIGVVCPEGLLPRAYVDNSLNRYVERSVMSHGSVPVRIVCGYDNAPDYIGLTDSQGAPPSIYSGVIDIIAHPAIDYTNPDASTVNTNELDAKISNKLGAVLFTNADRVRIGKSAL
ncbi:MAG: hypothetical protein WBP26_01290 [Candidatus Saccharimonadales bacterium]